MNGKTAKHWILRLKTTVRMKEALEQAAQKCGRTRGQEVEYRLQQSFVTASAFDVNESIETLMRVLGQHEMAISKLEQDVNRLKNGLVP